MKDPFALPVTEAPKKLVRRLTEGKIQEACVAYARGKKYWARKFSSPSQRSVPDYLFGKNFDNYVDSATQKKGISVHWAEEFKAPGKHPTDAQLEEQDKMVAAGWTVYRDTGTQGQVDIDAFKRRIDELEKRYG